jgi:hypothetical protein
VCSIELMLSWRHMQRQTTRPVWPNYLENKENETSGELRLSLNQQKSLSRKRWDKNRESQKAHQAALIPRRSKRGAWLRKTLNGFYFSGRESNPYHFGC